MKGFLHRIAATVERKKPRVLPLVEPIYSPVPLNAPAGSLFETAPGSAYAPSAQRGGQQGLFEPEENRGHDRAHQVAGMQAAPDTLSAGWEEPLRPQRQSQSKETPGLLAASGPNRRVVVTEAITPALANPALGAFSAVDLGERRESLVSGFSPVIIDPREPPSSDGANRPPPRVDAPAKIEQRMAPRGDASPLVPSPALSRTDEIQIHIGRIEVIAVSQPEPRRPASRPRKSVSLDEYLNRRNGGA